MLFDGSGPWASMAGSSGGGRESAAMQELAPGWQGSGRRSPGLVGPAWSTEALWKLLLADQITAHSQSLGAGQQVDASTARIGRREFSSPSG